MRSDVLLFDLDDTLIVESGAAVAACRAAALWRAAPTHPYCARGREGIAEIATPAALKPGAGAGPRCP